MVTSRLQRSGVIKWGPRAWCRISTFNSSWLRRRHVAVQETDLINLFRLISDIPAGASVLFIRHVHWPGSTVVVSGEFCVK